MWTLKLRIYKLSRLTTKRYALDKQARDLIFTKDLNHRQVYILLRNNALYVSGTFVYREKDDKLIGTIYKKGLARRIRVCYSLDKKRQDKRIWNA